MEERFYIYDNRLFKFVVEQDEWCDSPRDMYDNVGVMCIWWGDRYMLGDYNETRGIDPHEYLENLIDKHKPDANYEHGELNTMELLEILKTCEDIVYLDLHVFEHGMISVSTSEFATPYGGWDQGLAGFIWTDRDRYGYLCDDRDDWKDHAKKLLKGEVEEYDMYLQGEVYCMGDAEYDIDAEDFVDTDWCGAYFSDKYGDDLVEEMFKSDWGGNVPKLYEDFDEAMEEYRNTLLESGDYDSLLKLA